MHDQSRPSVVFEVTPEGISIKHNFPNSRAALGFAAGAMEALREMAYNEKQDKSSIIVPKLKVQ